MIWIVLAHIYLFSFGSVDNMQLALNYQDLFIAQPFLNAAIQVDTFFALRYILASVLIGCNEALKLFLFYFIFVVAFCWLTHSFRISTMKNDKNHGSCY